MTAAEIRDIITSPAYKQDLEELSSYLASIKQERPIVYALAKQLWKNGHKFQLEAKLKDLFVDGKHVEFKLNYDCDMAAIDYELRKHGDNNFKERWDLARNNKKSMDWSFLKIYEDICEKKTDLFIWFICSRDLSKLAADDIKRICWSKAQCAWSAKHSYEDRAYLTVADSFLEKLKAFRQFSILKDEIVTNGDFPSTYHLRICDIPNAPAVRA